MWATPFCSWWSRSTRTPRSAVGSRTTVRDCTTSASAWTRLPRRSWSCPSPPTAPYPLGKGADVRRPSSPREARTASCSSARSSTYARTSRAQWAGCRDPAGLHHAVAARRGRALPRAAPRGLARPRAGAARLRRPLVRDLRGRSPARRLLRRRGRGRVATRLGGRGQRPLGRAHEAAARLRRRRHRLQPVAMRLSPRGAAATVTEPIRIGVIGAGFFALASHLPQLARHGDRVQFVGASRKGTEMLELVRERYGFEVASEDYRDVLAAGVDACVVASPAALHHEHAKAALEAGAHVLVEKPVTLDPADAWDLV